MVLEFGNVMRSWCCGVVTACKTMNFQRQKICLENAITILYSAHNATELFLVFYLKHVEIEGTIPDELWIVMKLTILLFGAWGSH